MMCIAVVVIVVALAGWHLTRVARHLNRARSLLSGVAADVRGGRLDDARGRLAAAEQAVLAANGDLHGKLDVALLGVVPVARQNIQSLRRDVGLALLMTGAGRRLLEVARPLQSPNGRLDVPLRNGAVPVKTLGSLSVELNAAVATLPAPDDVPGRRFLVPQLGRLQTSLYRQAIARRRQFASLSRGLGLLNELAGGNGPRRYFLAVANEAEMRGSGGMVLSYGVLRGNDGKLDLERFGPIDEIRLARPAQVALPVDFQARTAPLAPTLYWRNSNLASDFTIDGPIMEAMYKAATNVPVDGVIQVDSAGLAAILAGIGPVDVPELGVVNAENAVALTLNEAYVRFPDRPIRQEYLTGVGEAVFRRLTAGTYDNVTGLAESLATAVAQRHVIAHAASPQIERTVSQLGGDGSLPDDSDFVQVALQNFSANKLDYYVDTRLALRGRRQRGKRAHYSVEIEVANTAPPDGRPPYIFGPAQPSFRTGEYRGLVGLYLPSGSLIVGHSGDVGDILPSTEASRTVALFSIDVPAGGRRRVTLDVRVPPRPQPGYSLKLVPIPRVRPTTVDVDVTGPDGPLRASGALVRTATLTSG